MGVALTMSGDAVSLIQDRLRSIASAYGYPHAPDQPVPDAPHRLARRGRRGQIYVHNCAPKGSLGWLLVVLFAAWTGQLAGERILDRTLSGFVGAVVMVPVAHLVARAPTAPPAHVMFLPAFWLPVPGAIGLIGITEIFGDNAHVGTENFVSALVSIPAIALGILVGTMIVRATNAARASPIVTRLSG